MSWAGFLGSHYEIQGSGDEVRICCPACGDQSFHGHCNVQRLRYICFKCEVTNRQARPTGRGLRADEFLQMFHGMTRRQAWDIIRNDSDHVRLRERPVKDEQPVLTLEGTRPLRPSDPSKLGTAAWSYLSGRYGSMSKRVCRLYRLRYGFSGRFAGRIVVPVYDGGDLVYCQGRSFLSWLQPKYFNPPVREKPLFGLPPADGRIYVVEGAFDVMAIGLGAYTGFGAGLTREQLRRLLALRPSSIYVAFDPDTAGRRGSSRLVETLLRVANPWHPFEVWEASDLPGDPGSLGAKARQLVCLQSVRR